MSKIKSILSISLCNIWGCVFSAYPFIFGDVEKYLYFIIKSEVWIINHCLG